MNENEPVARPAWLVINSAIRHDEGSELGQA